MANIGSPQQVVRVEERRLEVPSLLINDRNPSLGGDLKANGKDIKNVGDIEFKTYFGVDLRAWILDKFDSVRMWVENSFSKKDHRHNDIENAVAAVSSRLSEYQKVGDYATSNHTHESSEIRDLDKIIREAVAKIKMPEHSHKDIEDMIDSLKNSLNAYAKEADLETLRGLSQTIEDSLTERIVKLMVEVEDLKTEVSSQIAKGKNISIKIVEAPKRIVTEVIESKDPYIQMEKLGDFNSITTVDASGKEVESKIITSNKESILVLKGGTAPFTITLTK